MTRILLFDTEIHHAEALASSLRGPAREVTCCSNPRIMTGLLREKTFDAVILYSYRSGDWKLQLGTIRNSGEARSTQPAVICFARGYRGPQERLDAERKGIRLVYEG
jgi:hypothetical protein